MQEFDKVTKESAAGAKVAAKIALMEKVAEHFRNKQRNHNGFQRKGNGRKDTVKPRSNEGTDRHGTKSEERYNSRHGAIPEGKANAEFVESKTC